MGEVRCIKSFHEDGDEYWSRGGFYSVIRHVNEGYEIKNNFNGIGLIYDEDFDDYFVKA